MKKRNLKSSVLEKGGLMIEALAMLGLIAVVTPTMYKKSAERTMEVQDINTATTIRTIMRAADAYVAANYTYMVADMIDKGETSRNLPFDELENYLPYNFDVNKALYNYREPELTVRRQEDSNNLTVFAIFPAKVAADEGIGQERTSRIAALVGANGGFVSEKGKARGVGGIWKLEDDEFKNTFNDNKDANVHSIVTASTESINNFTSGELDNDKYLQRGVDDGENSPTYSWKNTMWTDLYLGDDKIPEVDVYNNVDGNTSGHHSIRNIYSLIVGTDEVPDGDTGYGLYISDDHTNSDGNTTTNPARNAYIAGTLQAVLKKSADTQHVMFKVDEDKMGYGDIFKLADNIEHRGFEVAGETGNTLIGGTLTNYGNLNLSALGSQKNPNGWDEIKIGQIDSAGNNHVLSGTRDNETSVGTVSLINGKIFTASNEILTDISGTSSTGKIKMMEDGYKKVNNRGSVADAPTPSYNSKQVFPVEVDSNMIVNGLFTAGQIDTQKLRTASFSSGSSHIDDEYQWLNVDADGVEIVDPDGRDSTTGKNHLIVNDGEVNLYAGTKTNLTEGKRTADSSAMLHLQDAGSALLSADKTVIQAGAKDIDYDSMDSGELRLETTNLAAKLSDNSLTVSNTGDVSDDNDYIKTTFDRGFVNMHETDLSVTDGSDNSVFTVKANDQANDTYVDKYAQGDTDDYKIAAHGNVIFTDSKGGSADTAEEGAYAYLSMGKLSKDAAVNIIPYDANVNPSEKSRNIVFIDQGATHEQNKSKAKRTKASDTNYKGVSEGTIYMRKGFLEINPSDTGSNDLAADEGYGVIKASRFVANNPDVKGTVVYASDAFSEDYGQAGLKDDKGYYYDTYMVNPAYTSVMKDIKLTTRGGARLSDILPDFVNKGIYVVSNTYTEDSGKTAMEKLSSADTNAVDLSETEIGNLFTGALKTSSTGTISDENYGASPLAGFVPAPQCPPGYAKAITLAPASSMSALAGDIKKNSKGRLYINPNDVTLDSDGKPVMPYYSQISATLSDGSGIGYKSETYKTDGSTTEAFNIAGISGNLTTLENILTSGTSSAGQVPLAFLQNGYLKAATKAIRNSANKYGTAWAVYLGYLYPEAFYNTLITALSNKYTDFKDKLSYAGSDTNKMWWNLFPVASGSIEGYATIYCYFDRPNYQQHTFNTDNNSGNVSGTYFDDWNGMTVRFDNKKPRDYNLNDPALKYKEVW